MSHLKESRRGFSMIEILVVISILALTLSIAVPSFANFMAQKRIRSATEDFYNHVRIANSEALRRSNLFYLSIRPGATWCYGLSNTAACNCSTAGSCMVDGVEIVVRSTDYSGQAATMAVTGFSGASTTPSIIFQGNLGVISAAGTVGFSLSGLSSSITVNTKGLASICSSSVKGYPLCP